MPRGKCTVNVNLHVLSCCATFIKYTCIFHVSQVRCMCSLYSSIPLTIGYPPTTCGYGGRFFSKAVSHRYGVTHPGCQSHTDTPPCRPLLFLSNVKECFRVQGDFNCQGLHDDMISLAPSRCTNVELLCSCLHTSRHKHVVHFCLIYVGKSKKQQQQDGDGNESKSSTWETPSVRFDRS